MIAKNLVPQHYDSKKRHLLWISPKKLAVVNNENTAHPKYAKWTRQVAYRLQMQDQCIKYQPKQSRQNRRKNRQVGGSQ